MLSYIWGKNATNEYLNTITKDTLETINDLNLIGLC